MPGLALTLRARYPLSARTRPGRRTTHPTELRRLGHFFGQPALIDANRWAAQHCRGVVGRPGKLGNLAAPHDLRQMGTRPPALPQSAQIVAGGGATALQRGAASYSTTSPTYAASTGASRLSW
jgi:hypothetical protein